MCALNNSRRSEQRPLLCYVTDRNSLASSQSSASVDSLLYKVDEMISAGVDWVQIREKDLSAKELSRVVREALQRAKRSVGPRSTRILVNDRVDVAAAEGAGGVHLTGNSVPVRDAKELVKKLRLGASKQHDFLVGVSCHSCQDAESAAASGADYLFFGPVFATPSKAAFGAAQGLDRLTQVCSAVSPPVIAIGGITLQNAASCIAAGAAGVAAIRLFQDAIDATGAVQQLRELVSDHRLQ